MTPTASELPLVATTPVCEDFRLIASTTEARFAVLVLLVETAIVTPLMTIDPVVPATPDAVMAAAATAVVASALADIPVWAEIRLIAAALAMPLDALLAEDALSDDASEPLTETPFSTKSPADKAVAFPLAESEAESLDPKEAARTLATVTSMV